MSEIKKLMTHSLISNLNRSFKTKYPQLAIFSQDAIGRKIISRGYFEEELLESLKNDVFPRLAPGKNAIDIGANIGTHSVFFSDTFGEVHSFEPNLRTFYLLQANALHRPNIKLYNFGCSDHAFEKVIAYSSGSTGTASLKNQSGPNNENVGDGKHNVLEATFKCDTLDNLIPQQLHDSFSFIKIDVEGHEAEALSGASKILTASSPIVAFEILPKEIVDGTTSSISALKDMGYDHFYYFHDKAPFYYTSKRLAKLINALSMIFLGKRLLLNFDIRPLNELSLKNTKYELVLASKTPFD